MPDKTVAFLDLTGCSMPYDFFDRIIIACNLGQCGHSWDAVFDFLRTETLIDTLCITGENAISQQLKHYLPTLHRILDDLNRFRMEVWNTPFTVIVLS